MMLDLLSELIPRSARIDGSAPAIRHKDSTLDYDALRALVSEFANGILKLGLGRGDRVAVFADKRPESVVAMFGVSEAGGVFVPVNGLLKPKQVAYILQDCNVRILVTTAARLKLLEPVLDQCCDLQHIILVDGKNSQSTDVSQQFITWSEIVSSGDSKARRHRVIASDMAAIMYTSGSTGPPKGVILSHTNMVIGAKSVATYIENNATDRILSALPLSFDAGLSQLTTGFYSGACVVLHEYLLASDIVRIIENEQITGLTAVPPLWIQLAGQQWPEGSTASVRYFANTGGKMPGETLRQLRNIFPNASPFLMYGLTESFRSTYLPPAEVDRRPDSIGKAIPNVEVLVVGSDGKICRPGEIGELVHRGPLVSLGYWNNPERTAECFKPAPGQAAGLPIPELAVWSGDSVRMDDEGYLYFVGRRDEMIKTSGYRVSPAEIEEIVYDTGLVSEVAAIGVQHPTLGQAIVIICKATGPGESLTDSLLAEIRLRAPNYMVPHSTQWKDDLPRNANGKLDRQAMQEEFEDLFQNGVS